MKIYWEEVCEGTYALLSDLLDVRIYWHELGWHWIYEGYRGRRYVCLLYYSLLDDAMYHAEQWIIAQAETLRAKISTGREIIHL